MSEKGTKRRTAAPPSCRFLTYAQVAAMLGYASRQGVWKAVRRGDVPAPSRVGGLVRFDEAAILAKLRGEAA